MVAPERGGAIVAPSLPHLVVSLLFPLYCLSQALEGLLLFHLQFSQAAGQVLPKSGLLALLFVILVRRSAQVHDLRFPLLLKFLPLLLLDILRRQLILGTDLLLDLPLLDGILEVRLFPLQCMHFSFGRFLLIDMLLDLS